MRLPKSTVAVVVLCVLMGTVLVLIYPKKKVGLDLLGLNGPIFTHTSLQINVCILDPSHTVNNWEAICISSYTSDLYVHHKHLFSGKPFGLPLHFQFLSLSPQLFKHK
jgi:hypothetical protein